MQFLRGRNDFFTSVQKALDEIEPQWMDLPGLIILGSHTPEDIEVKLEKIRKAREAHLPFLGICFGMQLMVIEYARNVLGLKDANSEEINPQTSAPVIIKMSSLRVGAYPVNGILESHWHNFMFNNQYKRWFDDKWKIDYTEEVAEVMTLKNTRFHTGVQFHPEYQSSKDHPHLIFKSFIHACKEFNADGRLA